MEASAQLAKVTQSADSVVVEMTSGRYSRTMVGDRAGRMSVPVTFGKLWLTLDRNGDIVSLKLRD